MELRHLRYFVGVAEALNFRAAAKKLRVSAPALSKQVKDLEEEMGLRLFDRDTTEVRLTNAGSVFLDEARDVLAGADQAQRLAKDAAQGLRGRLRIGYFGAIMAEYMPKCLAAYAAKFPAVLVELIDLNPEEQLAALQAGTIQLGFIAPLNQSDLPAGVFDVSVVRPALEVLLARSHPLAQRSTVTLTDLANDRMLVIAGPRWPIHRDRLWRVYHTRQLAVPETVEIARLEALLTMVAGNVGFTLLPWRRCLAYPEEIVLRPLVETGPELEVDIRAVWRDLTCPLFSQGFIDTIREVAQAC